MAWLQLVLGAALVAVMLYLAWLNHALRSTPDEVRRLLGPRWTRDELWKAYRELEKCPVDYTESLPPKLDRRYIVTGGSGLVGGYIVLQLLARGTPPESIRIVDMRKPERQDMLVGAPSEVDFVHTDISSPTSVDAAFSKPWAASVAGLPLTVFHVAAVIIFSDRSPHLYGLPAAVNVRGTAHVLAAARRAGADVFSATSSASISVRPVDLWALGGPRHFWQVLDDEDFARPLRPHEDFFGNYPASKAAAERLVCGENGEALRTGCIRPANGVYGNPADSTVGCVISNEVLPTWIPHIVQNFVHGANVAIAHLQHESILAKGNCPQAGRPFVVTDPNPPIIYDDVHNAVKTLSVRPLRLIVLPPVLVLLLSHAIEWYNLLPYRHPRLRGLLPEITGDARALQPGLFSICTHLVASDDDARRPVHEGGLGYRGVLTTLQGIVLEILEWNREQARGKGGPARRSYLTSVSLTESSQEQDHKAKL